MSLDFVGRGAGRLMVPLSHQASYFTWASALFTASFRAVEETVAPATASTSVDWASMIRAGRASRAKLPTPAVSCCCTMSMAAILSPSIFTFTASSLPMHRVEVPRYSFSPSFAEAAGSGSTSWLPLPWV